VTHCVENILFVENVVRGDESAECCCYVDHCADYHQAEDEEQSIRKKWRHTLASRGFYSPTVADNSHGSMVGAKPP
jgi:hypothetical protein